jgi:hypothetical protein
MMKKKNNIFKKITKTEEIVNGYYLIFGNGFERFKAAVGTDDHKLYLGGFTSYQTNPIEDLYKNGYEVYHILDIDELYNYCIHKG